MSGLAYAIQFERQRGEAGQWQVFRMNDVDWWVARNLEEAMADYRKEVDADCRHARALTDDELRTLKFTDTDETPKPVGRARSFGTELQRRVAAGLAAPELFATTEI